MVHDVFSITPEQSIEQCMQIMTENISAFAVMENEKLIGIISIGDVVREMISNKEFTINQLENYIQGSGYVA